MDDVTGIPLDALRDVFTRVDDEHDTKPIRSLDLDQGIWPRLLAYLRACHGKEATLEGNVQNLPLELFDRLPLDQVAKLVHSAEYHVGSEIERKLAANPEHRILRKIKSSMWQWGMHRAGWNEILDVMDGIRSFDLGVDGFTVTLDHTTWVHERGKAEHSGVWLDGVFAFLVFHKGRHVMTIGWSAAGERRILLQQVQTTSPTGNRWLFKLPRNRMEFIVDRMRAAFPGHRLHVADGGTVAEFSLGEYRRGLDTARARQDEIRRIPPARRDAGDRRHYAEALDHEAAMLSKIAHLVDEKPRIASFYRDVGRYSLGEAFEARSLTHYAIAA